MMKINRKALDGALERVIPYVDSKPAIPVLKGILFSPAGDTLALMSSNKNNSALTTVKCVSNDLDKSFCIDGRWVHDYVKKVTGEDIEISVEGQAITLKCNSTIVQYPAIEAADYPKFPEITGKPISIKQEDLKKAIRHTAFATIMEDTRPILACIHFEIATNNDTKELLAVSLDGCRLAVCSVGVADCDAELQCSANVRSLSMADIPKHLNGEDKCKLTFSDRMIFVEIGCTTYALEVDKGVFIDYQKIMSQIEVKTVVKLNKNNFLEKLDTLNLVKQDKPVAAIINVISDRKVVEIAATGQGTIKDEIAAIDHNGGDVKIGIKNQYMIEALKVMDGEDFTISLSEATKPLIVSPSGLYKYFYMIFPLKLQ